MLQAIDGLPDIPAAELPGVYLEVRSRVDERLKKDSLDASGLTLLRVAETPDPGGAEERATVFATAKGIEKLRKKVEARPEQPRHILTVHGVGYKFVRDASAD